jgi:hypothetical protein
MTAEMPSVVAPNRTGRAGNARALYASLARINPANPAATDQVRQALAEFGSTDLRDLRNLLLMAAARLLAAEGSEAMAAATSGPSGLPMLLPPPECLWQPSGRAPDGSDRPGFWCPIPDVGSASVRQCRSSGYGEPSWTAAINGQLFCDPGTNRPFFFATCAEAKETILRVAYALIPA